MSKCKFMIFAVHCTFLINSIVNMLCNILDEQTVHFEREAISASDWTFGNFRMPI